MFINHNIVIMMIYKYGQFLDFINKLSIFINKLSIKVSYHNI